jgi:hypothetical protein
MRPFVMAVAGCAPLIVACAYKPGSFAHNTHSFTGQRATVGCLDISVERRTDVGDWPVLDYTFGNRCDRPAPVDLAWTQVIGRTADGAEVALVPYDPKAEIRVLKIDGRSSGSEALTYPTDVSLGQVCVDVASLAQQQPAQWICFGSHTAVAMLDTTVVP